MKTEIIPVTLAVLLTGSILGGSLRAESGSDFRVASSVLQEGQSMPDDQVLDAFGCSGRILAKAVLEVTYKR